MQLKIHVITAKLICSRILIAFRYRARRSFDSKAELASCGSDSEAVSSSSFVSQHGRSVLYMTCVHYSSRFKEKVVGYAPNFIGTLKYACTILHNICMQNNIPKSFSFNLFQFKTTKMLKMPSSCPEIKLMIIGIILNKYITHKCILMCMLYIYTVIIIKSYTFS